MGIIRFLLALSVVSYHCGPIFGIELVGGRIAVQSFFIISGFYMSLILNEKYIGLNNSYKLFITNRFIRLFPVYWVVLLLTLLICLGINLITHGQQFPRFDTTYLAVNANVITFTYLIITNILIFGQDLVMFLGIIPKSGLLFFTSNFELSNPPLYTFLFVPQAWTLGLELMFYLIAPIILRFKMKYIVLIILTSFILRIYLYNYFGLKNDPWTYRFFPTEIMFFLIGYFSYRLYRIINKIIISQSLTLFSLIIMLLFTIIYSYIPNSSASFMPFSSKELLYFCSITLSIPLLFKYFKYNKLDSKIGELSYPIYISHLLVYMICRNLNFINLDVGWVVALITIVFSILLNKFITYPIEKYRQSRLNKLY